MKYINMVLISYLTTGFNILRRGQFYEFFRYTRHYIYASSNTLRFWEAVIYNKKLYTNWAGAVNSPYYDSRFMRVFNNPDEIDYDFIKERIWVNYNYQGELSPVKYLEILTRKCNE